MSTGRRLHHTYDEYLQALELSSVKLEYLDGEIYAMARGTPAHADLAGAVIRLFGNALLDRCRVSSSDLKVRIEATGLSTFADATVVCGERHVSSVDHLAVINPTVLVEVTSRSTEDYDRGDKLSHYKQIQNVRAVVFISHRRPWVTIVARTPDGWQEREARAGELLTLDEPRLSVPVDEIYAGITLDVR